MPTSLKHAPFLTEKEQERMESKGLKTLEELYELLEGRDAATVADVTGRAAESAEALRNEVGLALNAVIPVRRSVESALARHRIRLIALGSEPRPATVVAANKVLLGEIGRINKADAPSAEVIALEAREHLTTAQASLAAGDIVGALSRALEGVGYLGDPQLLRALPADISIAPIVSQSAVALEQIHFYLQHDQIHSFLSAVDALGATQKSLGVALMGVRHSGGIVLETYIAAQLTLASIWSKLASAFAWLRNKGEGIFKKLWGIIKKLVLLYEFYDFMQKYEGAVVRCYTFCQNWKDHGVDAYGNSTTFVPYADFWDCVQRCFAKEGITLSDALWDLLKKIGIELLLSAIDP